MRVMTILGSPRRDGNTAVLLNVVEDELRRGGAEVDHADITDYYIQGCRECWQCKDDSKDLCVYESDDANELLRRMIDSDCVLFAAPVFCWGFPAQLKPLLDRMFCLIDDYRSNPEYQTRMQGKGMALLVTSGGPVERNAELLQIAFENMVQMMKARLSGTVLVPNCRTGEEVLAAHKDDARTLADLILSDISAQA